MIEHREARELYDYAVSRDEQNREEAFEDLRFRAGEQWPDEERRRREQEGRPCLVLNMTGQYVRAITGAARQNPPSIKIMPADDLAAGPQAEQARQLATVQEGMIRAIEHRSRGSWQYVSALENAATCGIGHIRILTEYDERDPFKQEIRFASISDALSVVYDPDARRLTKEDGKFAFVTGTLSPRAFKAKYPKARSVSEWTRDERSDAGQYWETGQQIRIVEMFRRVEKKRKLVLLSNGAKVDVTGFKRAEMEALAEEAAALGAQIMAERDWMDYTVQRSVLNGADYLEDEVEFPSRYIPIVPVIGEEINIGEHRVRHGLVRFMRDPQRLYNYWRTSAVEMVALAPRAPFLATAAQIGPYKAMWDRAHSTPAPYLLYNPDPDAPTAIPTRATQPEPPSAMWTESRIAVDDLKAVTGIYDANLGAQGNETSGRAIEARQREGAVGTFLYVDNLRPSVERLGVIILDMLPRVYDTERTVAVMEENGEAAPVRINRAMPNGKVENQIGMGSYEVKVSTGPTWKSRREETAQGVLSLIQAVPNIMQVAGDIMVESLDFPRADEVAERLQGVMQMQQMAMQPEQPEQPNPADMAKVQLDAARAEKDAALSEKARAETEAIALENLARMAGLPPVF